MSISIRVSGFVRRNALLPLAFVTLSGLCSTAIAQTAPQLLPYTSKLIAGGGTAVIAAGATCPISGNISKDAYGDGCLATEIQIGNTASGVNTPGARGAVADSQGNVFFTDYNNGLVRRVDALTGIVTAVAGGATASPASGVACGTNVSTDIRGDGCLSTAVKLSHPAGLVFSPAGDLYFSDIGYANVRKIAATSGTITTGGIISLVAGNVSGTFGYASGVVAATGSYLQDPYGLGFDAAGNLYIADEYTKAEAVLVVNTNATGSTTVTGVTIPAGQIVKIAGATASGGACTNYVSSSVPGGCTFGSYTNGAVANSSQIDGPWAVATDPAGNVYVANEFNDNGFRITPAGIISTYGGIQGSVAKVLQRGPQGTFGMGSPFGVAADANSNVYLTDASSGVVWRIDGAGQSMYVVAGGATAVCSSATDSYGDGCPATQAKFGSSGTTFASATLPGPGIYGISVDSYSNLYTGDTETNLVREISSGTQFGTVGANEPTQTVAIHFAAGDSPAALAYSLTTGATNFSLGVATCKVNSDTTQDCLLPVTATPSALGAFTGTLQVVANLGGTVTFPLAGTYVNTPLTSTVVSYSTNTPCTGSTVYSNITPINLKATVISTGTPTGTVTFYSNGTQIGTPQAVSNGAATLTYTFATVGTYKITATYSGDSYFKTSTSNGSTSITSSTPTFSASTISNTQSTVVAGQTALYSFNLIQNVYAGTITMACSGLPANSSCSFSPSTVTASGCSVTNTVTMNINTQQGSATTAATSSFSGGGRGSWSALMMVPGVGLALLIGLRRRRAPMRYGQLWMALALLLTASGTIACSNNVKSIPATPSGTYSITVTATGSAGTVATFTLPLTVK